MSANQVAFATMSVFLQACKKEPTPFTPIWLMRQAGRYQPEYRAIRDKVSFLELCKTPDLAAEVTVLAAEQLRVDAAIIFADILLVLEPLGIGFEFTKGGGPKIHEPIRTTQQIDQIHPQINAVESLGFVMQSIKAAKRDLAVPLIGFSGAPFTLASYAIEGGGSKNYYETKKLMYGDPGAWSVLMEKLSSAITAYLKIQIDAGVDAIQLFDSWVGCLSPWDYKTFVAPFVKKIFDALPKDLPAIHFATGNPDLYPEIKAAGGNIIGVDWRTPIDQQWQTLGKDVGIMGNLDPATLLGPEAYMKTESARILDAIGNRPGHIFNLGHGIMPQAAVSQVQSLVDFVHEYSEKIRS